MWMPVQAPTLARLFAWHPQPIPVFELACVVAAALYGIGVWKLSRRGVRWPVTRSVCFLIGLILIIVVTATGIGGYGMMLFSAHMVQHMVLSMLAPVMLLLGAPVTLALRALSSTGAVRLRLLTVLHSRAARVLVCPAVTIPVFLVSLYGLYFTPMLDLAMSTQLGHTWMLAHFLLVGLLFFWPIMGIDPGPRRHGYPTRIAELLITMPFHAFFGIALMMSSAPVSQAFTRPPTAWGIDPVVDQATGGSIAWAFGEIPAFVVLLIVAVQWFRSDDRAARAADRQADRDGEAELARYNEHLARLAAHR